MKPTACILLPTYNEAENISILIPQIFQESDRIPTHDLHILVIDDNSPDGTAKKVRTLIPQFPNLHLLTGPRKGLGAAYQRGMEYAIHTMEADLVFQMDADLQHPPSLIPRFIALTADGFSLVIGSRFAPGGTTPQFSLWRRLLSLTGNALVRISGGVPPIHDCTSGFRCIKADLIKQCDFSFLSTRGYSYQSSLLFELIRNGAQIIEVPITFAPRVHGRSKLRFKDQAEFLLNILKIRFRRSDGMTPLSFAGETGALMHKAQRNE